MSCDGGSPVHVPGLKPVGLASPHRVRLCALGLVLRIARRHMRRPRTLSLRLGAVRGREPPAAAGVDAARHDGGAGAVDVADEPHGLGFAPLGGDLDRPRATGILTCAQERGPSSRASRA